MKTWKTAGALLVIALMVLTGCPAPTGGDDLPDNDGTTMVAAVPVISDWDQLGI